MNSQVHATIVGIHQSQHSISTTLWQLYETQILSEKHNLQVIFVPIKFQNRFSSQIKPDSKEPEKY